MNLYVKFILTIWGYNDIICKVFYFTGAFGSGEMKEKFEISLLYDFYSKLLSESQQKIVELYINEDLSLSEVANILSISRQGVRESLNNAQKKLRFYEEKLGLYKHYCENIVKIEQNAQKILAKADDEEIKKYAQNIIDNIDDIYM